MKKILMSFAVLALVGAAYFGVNAMSAKTDMSLFSQNIEALAQGEETPGGGDGNDKRYPVSNKCNVAQSANGRNKCQVTVISCQGSGEGCTPQKCPTHNHN